jgi:hypothetical protein
MDFASFTLWGAPIVRGWVGLGQRGRERTDKREKRERKKREEGGGREVNFLGVEGRYFWKILDQSVLIFGLGRVDKWCKMIKPYNF